MYHPDRKREFIAAEREKSGFSEAAAEKLFEILEQFEAREGKDVCEMTGSCLLRTVYDALSRAQTYYFRVAPGSTEEDVRRGRPRRDLPARETPSREDLLAILRCYGRWCAGNRISGATVALTELEDPARVRYRFRFVANPTHLKLYLDDLFPMDDGFPTLNDLYQSFFWLAFSGLMEEDTAALTSDCLDFRKMEIRSGGEIFPIYAEAVPSLMSAVQSTQFRINHPKYKKVSTRDRAAGDLILRGFLDFNLSDFRNAMMRPISRRYDTDFLTPYLNYRNVGYSGIFYRCFLLEMAGVRLDYDAVTRSAYSRKQGSSETLTQSNFISKQRKIMAGYAEWKSIFTPK